MFESPIGHNFQMLLPISYHTACGYMDQMLFSYVLRNDSHSKNQKTEKDWLIREKELEKLLLGILKDISPEVLKKYQVIVEERILRDTFDIAYRASDKVLLKNTYQKLKNQNFASSRDRLIYLAGNYKGMKLLYRMYSKHKRKTVM